MKLIDKLYLNSLFIISYFVFSNFHYKTNNYEIYEKEGYMLYEVCYSQDFDFCYYRGIYKTPFFLEYESKSKKSIIDSYKNDVYQIPFEINDSLKNIVDINLFKYENIIDSLFKSPSKIYLENNFLKQKLKSENLSFNSFEFLLLKMKFKYIKAGKKEIYIPNFKYKKDHKDDLLKKETVNLNYIISIGTISIVP